ncbi:hypothetical protein BEWA_050000 [Theileria equi strain WA]|uniref:Uncharacterized protein n=1 Tax=Theileria equi strain WA TaxID=1537102 RepID=L1LAN4_THEEQ|nr:hypothetical protein BEWA_050000 [Theileria equi strain WA]EKX72532.1 hypothetical protein BEWA_050000 [Theileria equi strain WA]|eukprot:XP_004831984.1 hypothetical protein BEWA_050000 [Theileria equi strain WA]
MGMFGLCFFGLHALKISLLSTLEKLATKNRVLVSIAVTVLISLIRQVLATYSLLISLLITKRGYEATFLSIPTFIITAVLLYEDDAFEHVNKLSDKRIRWTFHILSLFIYSYSFAILFNINHKDLFQHYKKKIRSKFSKSSGNKSASMDWKDDASYVFGSRRDEYARIDSHEPKSPWELQSDFSDESDN